MSDNYQLESLGISEMRWKGNEKVFSWHGLQHQHGIGLLLGKEAGGKGIDRLEANELQDHHCQAAELPCNCKLI